MVIQRFLVNLRAANLPSETTELDCSTMHFDAAATTRQTVLGNIGEFLDVGDSSDADGDDESEGAVMELESTPSHSQGSQPEAR